MLIDRLLPGQKFLNGKSVAIADLFQTEQATSNSGDDLGFATDHPSFGIRGWQVRHGQRGPVWSNDVGNPSRYCRSHGLSAKCRLT